MKTLIVSIGLLLLDQLAGFGQGFVNLNFENAVIKLDSSSPYYPYAVIASNAIPGWNSYISGVSQSSILYDDETGSDPAISLQDTNNFYSIIQGTFAVLLQGQFNPSHNSIYTNSVGIGQTGIVPSFAETLIFSAQTEFGNTANMQITFNGQNISFIPIGSGADFTIYQADISTFANQTGQLVFTVPYNNEILLDNIQFSATPAPEPSALALTALGGLFFLRRRK